MFVHHTTGEIRDANVARYYLHKLIFIGVAATRFWQRRFFETNKTVGGDGQSPFDTHEGPLSSRQNRATWTNRSSTSLCVGKFKFGGSLFDIWRISLSVGRKIFTGVNQENQAMPRGFRKFESSHSLSFLREEFDSPIRYKILHFFWKCKYLYIILQQSSLK